jgi:hypothetical protein
MADVIARIVESLRTIRPLILVVICLSSATLLFAGNSLTSQLGFDAVLKDYRWVIGTLFLVTLSWLSCLAALKLWDGGQAISRRIMGRQRSHVVDQILWRWRLRGSEVCDLSCYCPSDVTKLDIREKRVSVSWDGVQNYQVEYRCDTCGRTFGPHNEGEYRHREAVKRQIERGHESGQWHDVNTTNSLVEKPPRRGEVV